MENPGIKIRDAQYPFPTLDTINLAEERVLFVYADCVVRDFIPAHPDATDEEKAVFEQLQLRKIRNPDFKRSLAYIAYRRQHPDAEDAEVWKAAGEANALEADIAMLWGDGPNPQISQKPLDDKRSTSEPSSSTDSGSNTKSGSDLADKNPAPTGTSESDTSSPGPPRIELVS